MHIMHRTQSQDYSDHIKSFFLLYFVQGLPYGLQTRFLPIYFRLHGMSLTKVGLYKLLLVPWVLKAIWAPFVDKYGNKRMWLAWSLVLLIILCVLAAQVPPQNVTVLAITLFLFNLVTSVQDIALDALVIEVLTPSQLFAGNIAQVVGYKAGTLFSGGIFAWLTGTISWGTIYYSLAFLYIMGFYVSIFYLPNTQRRPSSNVLSPRTSDPVLPGMEDTDSMPHIPVAHRDEPCFFFNIFQTEGTVWMLCFLLLYKIGEQGVMNTFPLFLLDEGINAQDVGFWTGFIAQSLSVIGSTIGGLIDMGSMLKSLKLQLCVRAVSIFVIWLTVVTWHQITTLSYVCSIFFVMVLFLTSGGITTCTFTLTMQLSQKAPHGCRASHYTLLVTAEVLGKLLFSAAVGALTQSTGYSIVYSLFSILSIIILPMVFYAPQAVAINVQQ